MTRYRVKVVEIVETIVVVEANDFGEAADRAREIYRDDYVYRDVDYSHTEVSALNDEEE